MDDGVQEPRPTREKSVPTRCLHPAMTPGAGGTLTPKDARSRRYARWWSASIGQGRPGHGSAIGSHPISSGVLPVSRHHRALLMPWRCASTLPEPPARHGMRGEGVCLWTFCSIWLVVTVPLARIRGRALEILMRPGSAVRRESEMTVSAGPAPTATAFSVGSLPWSDNWLAGEGSNLQHPAPKAGVLPIELPAKGRYGRPP